MRKGLFKLVSCFTVLLGSVGVANAVSLSTNSAAPTDLGTVGSAYFTNTPGAGTSFADNYYFSLPSASDVYGDIKDHEISLILGTLLNIRNIESLAVSLFSGSTQVGTTLSASGSGVNSFFFGPLGTGTYNLRISGLANGLAGGEYSGAIGATPVPLPAAAWLLVSGLVAFGAVGRRKSNTAAAVAAAA